MVRLAHPTLWIAAIFAAVAAGTLWGAVGTAMVSPYAVVQDDGRHFVAWLRTMQDPSLFPGDPIAAYFTSLTPQVYRALYLPAVWGGIDIAWWHLLVVTPLGIGCFVAAANALLARLGLEPRARILMLAGLAAGLAPDMALGMPRSFRETIVIATLVFWLDRRPIALALCLGFGANMYPIAAMVAGVALALAAALRWVRGRRIDWREMGLLTVGGVGAVTGIVVFLLIAGDYGPTITAAEARGMANFGPEGRTEFFRGSTAAQMLCNGRGGLLPTCRGGPGLFPLLRTVATLLAGWAALLWLQPDRAQAAEARVLLPVLVVSGMILGLVAWAVLFAGHLPSRYRIVSVDVAWWFAVTALLALGARFGDRWLRGFASPAVTGVILLAAVVDAPAGREFNFDDAPPISAFLRAMPVDAMVAGLPAYVDSVPSFAARSVWVSTELTVPYKTRFLAQMNERAWDVRKLVGGPVDADWRAVLARTGIDFMVVDTRAPSIVAGNDELASWWGAYPAMAGWYGPGIMAPDTVFLQRSEATQACRVAEDGNLALIDLHCFAKAMP